ncbi:MAG: glycosyl transferase family 2 [Frankiales bacterium]|nr:glycosyl transferase family 2 [Frankiales bacterium]
MADVTVVMAAYGATEFLPAALESVLSQDCDESWEFVVVDDACPDGSGEIIDSYAARDGRLRAVHLRTNVGAMAAMEIGVGTGSGDLIVFLDNDDVAAPGWLRGHLAALRSYDAAGARLDHRRLNPRWLVPARGEVQRDGLFVLDEAPGSPLSFFTAMSVHRHAHEAIGGIDVELGMAGGDADYSWRLQDAGFTLGFAGDAVVHYRHRRGPAAIYRQARMYGSGFPLLAAKHPGRFRTSPVPAVGRWHDVVDDLRDIARIRRRGAVFNTIWRAGWRRGLRRPGLAHRPDAVAYTRRMGGPGN